MCFVCLLVDCCVASSHDAFSSGVEWLSTTESHYPADRPDDWLVNSPADRPADRVENTGELLCFVCVGWLLFFAVSHDVKSPQLE